MKKFPLILCAIALLSVIGWTSYGQKQNSSRVTWEYMVRTDHSLTDQYADLKALGAEGWELTAVTTRDQAVGDKLDIETTYYLKRQRSKAKA